MTDDYNLEKQYRSGSRERNYASATEVIEKMIYEATGVYIDPETRILLQIGFVALSQLDSIIDNITHSPENMDADTKEYLRARVLLGYNILESARNPSNAETLLGVKPTRELVDIFNYINSITDNRLPLMHAMNDTLMATTKVTLSSSIEELIENTIYEGKSSMQFFIAILQVRGYALDSKTSRMLTSLASFSNLIDNILDLNNDIESGSYPFLPSDQHLFNWRTRLLMTSSMMGELEHFYKYIPKPLLSTLLRKKDRILKLVVWLSNGESTPGVYE